MITFGETWQKELLKISKRTQKNIHPEKDWSPKNYTSFEKDIMLAFYIIRKLIDGKKLTNRIISTNIKGKKYANSGIPVNLLNNHRIQELYDYKEPKKEKFELKFLINQFVHSYIFYPVLSYVDEGNLKFTDLTEHNVTDEELEVLYENSRRELECILFTSDDKKNEFIYEIGIKELIKLFESVGNCRVNTKSYTYNSKKMDYDVKQEYEENLDFPF
ncbi:hypothetical protein [Sediminicola sp. 1XM1-17]|uniref:hypothetical protein n=1 Tax=Sediminicola sp. 1XM1-17 TaxID=3127702 RepID=UPI003076FD6A